MPTIKDVAKAAGVSATTVSIIINGRSKERGITEETKEKVLKTIKELGYQPNFSARRLRSQDTSKPIIAFFWPLDYRIPILAAFLNLLQKEIQEQELDCELIIQGYENDRLDEVVSSISKNSYSAVIVGAASNRDISYLEAMNPNIPIVLINRTSEVFSTVCVDNREIGFLAAKSFKKKGYKEAGIISVDHSYEATGTRTQAFIYACTQLGINISEEHIVKNHSNITGGMEAALCYSKLKDPPKALFFESDSMAIGALYSFHQNMIRVPQDIEILTVGMLESESTAYCVPSLSVINMPNEKISRSVIKLLKGKLQTNDLTPVHERFEAELIERESFKFE